MNDALRSPMRVETHPAMPVAVRIPPMGEQANNL
jgi:hypothetical protein